MKKLTTEEWIKKAKQVRGDRYDYSKVNYIDSQTKVCIICSEHGEFWQTPKDHVNKLANCPECGKRATYEKQRSSTKEFIIKAKKIHGNKYDYSKVDYKTAKTKVQIGCYKHGWFWQTPNNHLNGQNCPECVKEIQTQSQTLSIEEFIRKAIKVHGNKYDYSKVNYINSKTKVCIICPKHGEFEQIANNHIRGAECPKCALEKIIKAKTKTSEQFINEANKTHNNKYNYDKTDYKGCFEKVIIICPIHGEFVQRAYSHLSGQGCPKCSQSHGERLIENYLENNNIKYIPQYEVNIDTTINSSGYAYIDFYLPEKDIYIEYNGIQHYKYVPFLHKGGVINFNRQIERDNFIRNKYKNKLIEFSYLQSDEEILKKLNELK